MRNLKSLMVILLVSLSFASCQSMNRMEIMTQQHELGQSADGSKWVMQKFATVVSGGDVPGYACDETVFVRVDKSGVVQDIRMDVHSKKECFGEESLRKTVVGTVLPSAIQGAAFVGGMSVIRPARSSTKIDNDNSSEGGNATSNATGGTGVGLGGNSSSSSGSYAGAAAGASAGASANQSQGQYQGQGQSSYNSNSNSNNNSNNNSARGGNGGQGGNGGNGGNGGHGGSGGSGGNHGGGSSGGHTNHSGGGDGTNPGGHGNDGGFNNPHNSH